MRLFFQLVLLGGLFIVPLVLGCRPVFAPVQDSLERFYDMAQAQPDARDGQPGKVWYRIDTTSAFGLRTQTLIEEDGQEVIARSYVALQDGEELAGWEESTEEIGSHEEGATAESFFELHRRCERLMHDPDVRVHVAHDEHGVLSVCSAVVPGCADDCDQGFRVGAWGFGDAPAL